ncbi:hypothetical protein GYMLUDRAFT_264702 [Collybiopsis luxurians FD-317 M1]|uniref:Protein kinase domain-containing protein n=1 Tax=Collybiopsis luxurians FD-317 M1 TaxID=944289 RepID=A0A0D0BI41_9AGAR|nr:hypothetical protein GYMLUDRAFT_264702 [Collybiopsis luxurians FD-317 M1]
MASVAKPSDTAKIRQLKHPRTTCFFNISHCATLSPITGLGIFMGWTLEFEGEDSKTSPFSFFSTLTVATNADEKTYPFSLHLSRDESFAPRRFDDRDDNFHPFECFFSFQIPRNAAHLQLELGECLGEGRSGKAFSARVLGPLPDLPASMPSELVVKVARLNHCRNLAREAWVYNFLDRHNERGPVGTVIPRCYGFFTAKLADCDLDSLPSWSLEDLPWAIAEWEHHPERDDSLEDDCDVDERVLESFKWLPEEFVTKDRSKWNSWKPDFDDPLVAVLLLEKGGVAHDDFRMPNLIRAPPTAQFCRRHKRVHQWYIIDFSRVWVLDIGREHFKAALETIASCTDYQSQYFYGIDPDD